MVARTPQELRDLAKRFREMAQLGQDEGLKSALRQLAAEFEQEADEADGAAQTCHTNGA